PLKFITRFSYGDLAMIKILVASLLLRLLLVRSEPSGERISLMVSSLEPCLLLISLKAQQMKETWEQVYGTHLQGNLGGYWTSAMPTLPLISIIVSR
ncbi:hypothetical protein AKJ16_DCAP06039, partial [Drosera capensis]